jgi:DNA invertase Pin-like site-specific DNA recombinase
MHRAVVFLRVSTIDQTAANQERELREVAGRMGCEIVRATSIMASAAPGDATSATAKTLGLQIPDKLLAIAVEVIE